MTEVEDVKSLAATKTVTNAAEGQTFGVGDTVAFDIVVENDGNTTQENVVVAEQLNGARIIGAEMTGVATCVIS